MVWTADGNSWSEYGYVLCTRSSSRFLKRELAEDACLQLENKCAGIIQENCLGYSVDYIVYYSYSEHHILCTIGAAKQSNISCVSTPSNHCPNVRCKAHTKCPAGKYTKTVGSATAQPKCEACAAGFFKAYTSQSSLETDSCTTGREIQCPPGKHIKATTTAQPQCETCATGFFKTTMSTSSAKSDSCTAHTKCPPGKFTKVGGSSTAQPQCVSCATGFFKAFTSENSTCIEPELNTGTFVSSCSDAAALFITPSGDSDEWGSQHDPILMHDTYMNNHFDPHLSLMFTILNSDNVSWSKVEYRACPRPRRGFNEYGSLQEAIAACLKAGARCGVIENVYCRDSSRQFHVCRTELFFTRVVRSAVGTCLWTSSNQPTLGLFSLEFK